MQYVSLESYISGCFIHLFLAHQIRQSGIWPGSDPGVLTMCLHVQLPSIGCVYLL